ncbi:glutaredoxin family protein [Virgibacillus necropolis]|uniref:Thioredoxin family protein n=1 Tax=Virgibacillus necropolis TaxID=163877 RepID=A0A221MAU9_9BACI|nr:glutaredoxin family protein [Virgibacillus necropolis]ASN04764.1 thioredoxin family protein [Virgibacillus necropolis]
MIHITFYTKAKCSLCDEALSLVELLINDYSCTLEIRDIYSNEEWLEKYHLSIPVISVDGIELNCEQISFESLDATFREAQKKHKA